MGSWLAGPSSPRPSSPGLESAGGWRSTMRNDARVVNCLAVRPGRVLLAINNGQATAERLVDRGVVVVPIDCGDSVGHAEVPTALRFSPGVSTRSRHTHGPTGGEDPVLGVRPARTLKGSRSQKSIPGICSESSPSNSDSKKLTQRSFPDAKLGGGTRGSRRGGRLFHLAARTRKPVDALAGPTAAGYANALCEASDRSASREYEGDALTQTTIRAACALSLAVSLERRQCYE
jgi:hypothetical protein